MAEILLIILPVFLVLGFGYCAVWAGLFSDAQVDGLMKFTQTFAIPTLLFRAISQIDMGQNFELPLLFSFFSGVVAAFIVGLLGARILFGRPWEDAVAISFCCLFSNTVLLGLPITERAYGPDALLGNYAILALHAPFGYMLGITAMEVVRAKGTPLRNLPKTVGKAMFSNALVLGIVLGLVVNLGNLPQPQVFVDAVDMMVSAALPAALFGLGGVLYRYRPEGDMRTVLFICAVSLGVHPAVAYLLGTSFDLSTDSLRSAVLTAAMAPGINAYIFANMYGVAKRVGASSVLIGTALSVVTSTLWITALP